MANMFRLIVLTLLWCASTTHAQGFNDSACPAAFEVETTNNILGSLSTCIDNDPNFVYTPENCTSTSQKFIDSGWLSLNCRAAFDGLCGQTSANSAVEGQWTWSWMQDQGSACQAGLYQAADQSESISEDCCRRNFEIMLKAVTPANIQAGVVPDDAFNRVSVNIQPGGFPHTTVLFDGHLQGATNGVSVDGRSPSYILQG
ncbi:MAG: hypothetical protein Q9191_005639 [Dirinaria sp. TL-2023a]